MSNFSNVVVTIENGIVKNVAFMDETTSSITIVDNNQRKTTLYQNHRRYSRQRSPEYYRRSHSRSRSRSPRRSRSRSPPRRSYRDDRENAVMRGEVHHRSSQVSRPNRTYNRSSQRCRFIDRPGGCKKGDNCEFDHSSSQKDKRDEVEPSSKRLRSESASPATNRNTPGHDDLEVFEDPSQLTCVHDYDLSHRTPTCTKCGFMAH